MSDVDARKLADWHAAIVRWGRRGVLLIGATLLAMPCLPARCRAADAPAASAEVLASAQVHLQAMARQGEAPLDAAQIAEARQWLRRGRVLEAARLAPATIEALGKLALRGSADLDFQDDCLDGWNSLWTRIGTEVDPLGYAYLMDRIARSHGQRLRYGTLPPAGSASETDAAREELRFASHRNMLGLPAIDSAELQRRIAADGMPALALAHPVYPRLPRLRERLLRLVQADQAARVEPEHAMSQAEQAAWQARLLAVDAKNLPAIQAIHARYGFPTTAMVGRAGTQAAFLLIQHAIKAPALMRRAAHEAETLAARGELPYIDYALLADRVACLIEHKPQPYGTQGNRVRSNYWYCPIAAPAQLNQRRAKLFLPPLDHEDIYGPDAQPAGS